MNDFQVLSDVTAIRYGGEVTLAINGGLAPYKVELNAGGVGGSVELFENIIKYKAPIKKRYWPDSSQDTIKIYEGSGEFIETSITVAEPLLLFCEVIQKQMRLKQGQVYLWDQKIMRPINNELYVVVGVVSSKIFGNTSSPLEGMTDQFGAEQATFCVDTLSVNLISRTSEARDRRGDLLAALTSFYSEQQQERNSFRIYPIPGGGQFLNLSELDGDAIPYRFSTTVNISYAQTFIDGVDYYEPDTRSNRVNTIAKINK